MTGRVLVRPRPEELAALTSGVCQVLTSAVYQRILHSYPADVLDSPDKKVNPLPRPPLLQGTDAAAIFDRLIPVIGRYGYRIEVVQALDVDPGANGGTWHSRRLVQINGTRSALQQAKTLAHEAVHVARHGRGRPVTLPIRVRELQAETCAWVLLHRIGVDSGAFSFPFIAKYGAVRQGAVLQADWALPKVLHDVSALAGWVIAQMPAMELAR